MIRKEERYCPPTRRGALQLIKKGNHHVDLRPAENSSSAADSSTNYVRRSRGHQNDNRHPFLSEEIFHAIRYVTVVSAVSDVQPWGWLTLLACQ